MSNSRKGVVPPERVELGSGEVVVELTSVELGLTAICSDWWLLWLGGDTGLKPTGLREEAVGNAKSKLEMEIFPNDTSKAYPKRLMIQWAKADW